MKGTSFFNRTSSGGAAFGASPLFGRPLPAARLGQMPRSSARITEAMRQLERVRANFRNLEALLGRSNAELALRQAEQALELARRIA
jgi:hypothetical protein